MLVERQCENTVRSRGIQWSLESMSARRSSMGALILRQCVSTATLGALLASALNFSAAAADAPPWVGDARSAMRLVAGRPLGADGSLRGAVRVRLWPRWNAYCAGA